MTIKYPRKCDACGLQYAYDSSFARHRTTGKCQRAQMEQKNIQQEKPQMIHTGTGDQININVQVNGNPEWLDVNAIDAALIQPILKMLKERKVEGAEKTGQFIRDNVCTISDYMEVINPSADNRDLNNMVDEVVELTKNLGVPKAYTEPLRLLFGKIFQSFGSKIDFSLDDMCRRPVHLHKKDDALCSVVDYDNIGSTTLGWRRAHWQNLLIDILHLLGTRLYDAFKCLDDTITDDEGEIHDKAFPFKIWWERYGSDSALLLGDKHVNKLMDQISAQVLRECNNDLMKGWHRLIEYCSILHQKGTLSGSEDVYKEREKKLYDMDNRRMDIEADMLDGNKDDAAEHAQILKDLDALRKSIYQFNKRPNDREDKRNMVLNR